RGSEFRSLTRRQLLVLDMLVCVLLMRLCVYYKTVLQCYFGPTDLLHSRSWITTAKSTFSSTTQQAPAAHPTATLFSNWPLQNSQFISDVDGCLPMHNDAKDTKPWPIVINILVLKLNAIVDIAIHPLFSRKPSHSLALLQPSPMGTFCESALNFSVAD